MTTTTSKTLARINRNERARQTNPLSLGRKMRPTTKHRPAVWENMLGTVYAMNDDGDVRYFDYRWEDAIEFAGVTPERDPRTHRFSGERARYRYHNGKGFQSDPRRNQLVLWIKKETNR